MEKKNNKKSGWGYKKERDAKENERKKQANALTSYLQKPRSQLNSQLLEEDTNEKPNNQGKTDEKNFTYAIMVVRRTLTYIFILSVTVLPRDKNIIVEQHSCNETVKSLDTIHDVHIAVESLVCTQNNDIYEISSDPAEWGKITDKVRQTLIEKGPVQIVKYNFPVSKGRQFTPSLYSRQLPNGEKVLRPWLIYSKQQDAVFCFACKLFNKKYTNWGSSGHSDWSHLSRDLKSHESSRQHLENAIEWKEFDSRLKTNNTIDAAQQRALNAQVLKWQEILKRIISVLQFLASQSLAIRGTSQKLYVQNNGNFLKLFANHLQSVSLKATKYHYLSNNIQNELIKLISNKIKLHIVNKVKKSKYYSIIVDCTPDKSHVEQMTLIVRCVEQGSDEFEIQEHFLGFIPVTNTSGEGLTKIILDELRESKIDVVNLRGQGYDNGANMKGKRAGVQNRILQINPRAVFIPCGCHSLNLVINDAASNSGEVANTFSIIQQIYVFFSSSTSRWDVLTQNVTKFTVKPVCPTRWESRISALKPLRFQLEQIYDALLSIHLDINRDSNTKCEAGALAKSISSFKFICSLVLWYDILSKVNSVSKLMQNPKLNVLACLSALEELLDFLRSYRTDSCFLKVIEEAKVIGEAIEIECQFPAISTVRPRKKKRSFDYESEDQPILDPQHNFKINVFNFILDTAINSISDRFEQMKSHTTTYKFLYNIFDLKNKNRSDILKMCKDLEAVLTDGDNMDIDGTELCEEIISFTVIMSSQMEPKQVLNHLHQTQMITVFPNLSIALRIMLTLPVGVATGERSFSKLKIIKNYLRSSTGQERLVGLAMMSIENNICSLLDYNALVQDFAELKVRKVNFK